MLTVQSQSEANITKPGQFELQPTSFEQAVKYAEIIAKSNFVPKEYKDKPGDVLIVIQMGQEVGLKPFQSLQNIACINGRPSMWGDAVLGLVRASGFLEYIKEYRENKVGHCFVMRKGDKHEIHTTYSIEDAKRAGLLNKDNWTKYEDRMLQMRARSFALRDGFPDVLKGIICREEAEDYPVEKTINPDDKVSAIKNIVVPQHEEKIEAEFDEVETPKAAETFPVYFETFHKLLKNAKTFPELKEVALNVARHFKGTPTEHTVLRNLYSVRRDELKGAQKDSADTSELDKSWEEFQGETEN